MVKRTITFTTIFLILTIAVSLIIVLNRSSFAADDDIASGTSGTCSWVIDSEGVLTISPTDGVSGVLKNGTYLWPMNGWNNGNNRLLVKKIIICDGVKTNEHGGHLFSEMPNCIEMDLAKLNTENCTSMDEMFTGSGIAKINLNSWDTSKVTNMEEMFEYCNELENINMSNCDTSKVTNMEYMFAYCEELENINMSNCDTSNVTNMNSMFKNCSKLTELDLSNWNTSSLKNISRMFEKCSSLNNLDLSNWNTSQVTDMYYMFYACYNLKMIKLSPNFSFDGNGDARKALLPTPNGVAYTGKWIHEDETYGPYTPIELRDTYDGTTMAGKWIWQKATFTVSYSYEETAPSGASELPQDETHTVGEQVTVAENATAQGYTFSGWSITGTFEMPAEDIIITGYFIEIPKSYSYKVEYFFDGELDDSLEEIMNAEKDEEISITPQTSLKHEEKNYILVSNNHNITISINDEDNVINVYYESDVLDYEFEYPEGDGIPDKYQIKIRYRVENGSWNDGTSLIKTNVITLYDENGNPSEQGIGKTTVPAVGEKPDEGYTQGFWNKEIPRDVSSKDNGDEFIYSYEKIVKADIAELGGKGSNPKTNDVIQNYLIVSVGGVLVLALVSRIRKRYSRKARKIQY